MTSGTRQHMLQVGKELDGRTRPPAHHSSGFSPISSTTCLTAVHQSSRSDIPCQPTADDDPGWRPLLSSAVLFFCSGQDVLQLGININHLLGSVPSTLNPRYGPSRGERPWLCPTSKITSLKSSALVHWGDARGATK